ncbi:NAD(P)H-binding protein [Mycolicibacterium hodleri]|uniref:NmrA family transcriptional regulator n=1 Tax=Mycolicibacterium hodleri TaxID=49897 RepID=A0A502EFL8_9MYCO|nr:NAD(P)H-binding protein [Mycolicibacterium hodleri]TPG35276.1 NmrA family transcriptional regulator [Mycolicibacterium hodleri]
MSTTPKLFLVTGATGNTGVTTVGLLLERGHRVRAFVHSADARSERLAAAGAEIAVGDLLDFEAVSAAMEGVDGAYFCYPIAPGLLEATAFFAQAAAAAGVRSVVNMSQISARRDAKSHAAQNHWIAERLLDRTPMLTAHVRPTFFAEWLDWYWATDGSSGVIRLPMGAGRHAPIAGEDQAYVIAAILEDAEPHDRQIYPLVGPVELDQDGIAATIGDTLAIPVHYEPIEIAEFSAGLTAKGFPAHLVQHLSNVVQDYRDGIFAGTNDVIERIGGRTPMTVQEYVDAHRDAFSHDGPYAIPAPVSAS